MVFSFPSFFKICYASILLLISHLDYDIFYKPTIDLFLGASKHAIHPKNATFLLNHGRSHHKRLVPDIQLDTFTTPYSYP